MLNPIATNYENFNEHSLGATMERNTLKEKMRCAAEKCGTALLQFYMQTQQERHEKSMRYVMKDLLYKQTEDAEYLCETIYDEANRHLTQATRYGYTPDDLATLRTTIDAYRLLLKNNRQTIVYKKKLDDIMQDSDLWGGRKAA